MIELRMVERMAKRAVLLAPALIIVLWALQGPRWALSAAVGLAMTLANLYLAGRIIGGVAERTPKLLLPTAIATLALGLMLLTVIALGLRAADAVNFTVTGVTLIISHLGLVLWEASGAYSKLEKPPTAEPHAS